MLNPFIDLYASQPWLAFLLVGIFAATVGSFLNVVIYRLPVMMERKWRAEFAEFSSEQMVDDGEPETFNLLLPASRCGSCGSSIKPWHNIPVLSWILLRGRCAVCHSHYSIRYPLVEAFTALISVFVVWHFQFSLLGFAVVLFSWLLICLTLIDADTYLLPDPLNYLLLWGGLLTHLWLGTLPLGDAILGAVFGYLSLWSVYWGFKLLTGKEGMGYGDFKLLAALGAWCGWQQLPLIILLSSLVGAVLGLLMIALAGRDKQQPIPFGPYLAIAGWIAMLWGEQLTQAYINMVL